MPRTWTPVVTLDRQSHDTLQTQLVSSLRQHLQGRQADPRLPLPSSRALAEDLCVSRNTVTAAYDQLVSEGYLDAVPRTGLFVSAALTEARVSTARPRASVGGRAHARPMPPLASPQPFRPCQPDVRLFPLRQWNRLRARMLRTAGSSLLDYQRDHALGLPRLRQALAVYLRDSRGVRCDWRDIAITSGSQMALFLLAHAVLDREGTRVLMEDPGYPGARHAWRHRRATIDAISVDGEGAVPPDAAARRPPALVYLTPSRQHPTGARLPVARRVAWLEFCRSAGAWLVEDDYDSEFRYGRAPLPSLHSLDVSGQVIYVGSMSKVLFPSLRIGYVVLAPALVDRVAAVRDALDNHGPLVDQATLAAFLETGAFASHLRRCRRHYHERQQVFLDAARQGGLPLEFPHVDGGMNLLGRLPASTDDTVVSSRLDAAGFDVPALSHFATTPVPPGLVFGYTAFDPARLRREVARMARVLEASTARGRTRSGRRRWS